MAGERILIVEDNASNLKLITLLISGQGYEITTAGTGQDALTIISTRKPRLILMDLQLPNMDGFTLARRIKAAPAMRDIIIVAVTAYAMKGDEQRARDAGCDEYLTKPIDRLLLRAVLDKHLGGGTGPA